MKTSKGASFMQQARTGKEREKELQTKTVPLTINVSENIKDDFRSVVERNGKTIEDVLKLYMQKYIWKQGELQRNRQKKRESIGQKVIS